MGGVPSPTAMPANCHDSAEFLFSSSASLTYSNFAFATDLPMGIVQPIPTEGVPGGAPIMRRVVVPSGLGKIQSVMPELLNYLETLPEISSIYSGHDIRTCTKPAVPPTKPGNVGQGEPPAHDTPTATNVIFKTSVLLMQTSTQAPIIKTADAPAPPPQQQTPPPPPPTPDNKNGVPASVPVPVPEIPIPNALTPPVIPAPGLPATQKPVAPVVGLGALGNAIVSALVPPPAGTPSKPAQAGITLAPSALAKPAQAGITIAPTGPATLSFAGQMITANSAGQFVVAPGTTLTPGGSAQTIAGSTISIGFSPAGATIAVINGQTSTLSAAVPTFAAAPALTIDGITFAPSISAGSTFYVVDGTTLAQGQIATIHGTTLSLASSGDVLVINGVASFIPKATASIQYFEGAAIRGEVGWIAGALTVIALGFGVMM